MPTQSIYQTPNSVKTLRAYYKSRTLPDPHSVAAELTEASDRAAVILLAALLDERLTYKLTQQIAVELSDDDIAHAFRFEGPMGAFSHKIEIAYLFGATELDTYKDLNIIRELRNACAHSSFIVDFSRPELANVVRRLFLPRGIFTPTDYTPSSIRNAFNATGVFLIQTLVLGSRAQAFKSVKEEFEKQLAERFPSPDKPPPP